MDNTSLDGWMGNGKVSWLSFTFVNVRLLD
jgi:hypothetical protein